MKIKTVPVLLVAASLLIASFTGCESKGSQTPAETSTPAATSASTETSAEAAILAYADPATETLLQGINEDNLAKYVQYGDAAFKAAVTQQMLDQISSQINSQLGTYVSRSFVKTEEQQGYIIVHYTVKYSKGSVGLRMVFDSDHLIAGQFFE